MKAIQLHAYEQLPVLDDVPEPGITGPLDVIVEVGGAGLRPPEVGGVGVNGSGLELVGDWSGVAGDAGGVGVEFLGQ